MKQILTKRQKQVYDFICQSILTRGYPPTCAEVAEHLGVEYAVNHLNALHKKGWIVREKGSIRGLVLTEPVKCPHCGMVISTNPAISAAQSNAIGETYVYAQ